jgi:hypothetical protein
MAERITPEKALDLKTTRKASDWSEVDFLPKPSKGQVAYLKTLPVYPSSDEYAPLRDLVTGCGTGIKMPQRFVVRHKGAFYYVNTEGYAYCRYVLRVPAEIFGFEEILRTPDEPKVDELLKESEPEQENTAPYYPAAELPESYNERHHKKLVLAVSILTSWLALKGYPEDTKALAKAVDAIIAE